jgi:hypothetical protein
VTKAPRAEGDAASDRNGAQDAIDALVDTTGAQGVVVTRAHIAPVTNPIHSVIAAARGRPPSVLGMPVPVPLILPPAAQADAIMDAQAKAPTAVRACENVASQDAKAARATVRTVPVETSRAASSLVSTCVDVVVVVSCGTCASVAVHVQHVVVAPCGLGVTSADWAQVTVAAHTGRVEDPTRFTLAHALPKSQRPRCRCCQDRH